MKRTRLAIPDVLILEPRRNCDTRGFFSEVYNSHSLKAAGLQLDVVQINHSLSHNANTLRGLHFQKTPKEQGKLVRVVRGAILDVAVDIRTGSASFGKWVSAELSADAWTQMYIPKGFAHGFLTLQPETEVEYITDNQYASEFDVGIAWNDPDIAIDWPLHGCAPIISERDKTWPKLKRACSDLGNYPSSG